MWIVIKRADLFTVQKKNRCSDPTATKPQKNKNELTGFSIQKAQFYVQPLGKLTPDSHTEGRTENPRFK